MEDRRIMRFLIAVALLVMPTAVSAEWREAKTDNFLIYGDKSEDSLARFAERIEAVHHLMAASEGLEQVENSVPVKIYLYGDSSDMEEFTGQQNVAGFYRAGVGGAYAVVPENASASGRTFASHVLFHEYAHHFMLQYYPGAYPAWYIEGRAELVGTADFDRNGTISYGKANENRAYTLQNATWVDVGDIVSRTAEKLNASGFSFYAESWLLTHYLTFNEERRGQLAAYLNAINSGASMAEAAEAFGDLDRLNRDLRDYLRRQNFSYRNVPLPDDLATNIEFRTLSDGEIALLRDRIDFARSMEKDEAIAFLAAMRRTAAPYMDDPFVLQLLGEAELDLDNYDAAEAHARRLLAIVPEAARANWLMGRVLLDRAEDGDRPDDQIKQARSFFLKANRANPRDPLPLIGFYDSYALLEQGATAEAVGGLESAMNLVPQAGGLRLKLASELLSRESEGDQALAALILRPLAFAPHGGNSAKKARAMIDYAEGRSETLPSIDDADEEETDDGEDS